MLETGSGDGMGFLLLPPYGSDFSSLLGVPGRGSLQAPAVL